MYASKQENFDIIYLRTKDFDKILDYKEAIETVLDEKVRQNLKIVGSGKDEYALIYDCNLSARVVSKTLIKHAELLAKTGFDEPIASKDFKYYDLYNVCYGMGRNLESLIQTYQLIYSSLGEETKRDLFIEKTDFGNYILVYHMRGDQASTIEVAKNHAALLRGKKIVTTLTKENSNEVVYGESSLINDSKDNRQIANSRAKDTSVTPIANTTTNNSQKTPPHSSPAPQDESARGSELVISKTKTVTQIERASVMSTDTSKYNKAVTEYLNGLRSKGVIGSDESTGWMVYDLESDKNILGINTDIEFQAASMIKPFVALAFFHRVKEGKLQYDKSSQRHVEAMIQRSSNSATNFIMRRAGGPEQCNAIIKKYYGNLFRKTEIKEYIPADGRTYLNSASPADYIKFLRALWNLDLPYSKEIQRVMALPKRDRIYYGTTLPRGTLVFNKTGTTAHLCGDMGIIVTRTQDGDIFPYAIVGIIERKSKATDYSQWMASRGKVIREISSMVYENLRKDHHLL